MPNAYANSPFGVRPSWIPDRVISIRVTSRLAVKVRIWTFGGLALLRSRPKHFLDLPWWYGPAEMIALHFIAIVLAQECNLLVGFNALGDDSEI